MTYAGYFANQKPDCRLLLLVSQGTPAARNMAAKAELEELVDDFVFYDSSLDYLFAKLSAL